MNDNDDKGAAFIRAVMGPSRPVDDAALRELGRTPAMRSQLDRVKCACVLMDEIETTAAEIAAATVRVRAVLRVEIAALNRMHLAEVAAERGISFDG
jgi:hypothetical protein